MKLGILRFAEVNLTMPFAPNFQQISYFTWNPRLNSDESTTTLRIPKISLSTYKSAPTGIRTHFHLQYDYTVIIK